MKEPILRTCVSRDPMLFGRVSVTFYQKNQGGVFIAAPLTLNQIPENSDHLATMMLEPIEAQLMLDQLWQSGIRPSDGDASIGMIGAMKEHLADMRRLVFKEKKP